jgi:hypothetical protein
MTVPYDIFSSTHFRVRCLNIVFYVLEHVADHGQSGTRVGR